jgi:hypothetical protein
MVTFKKLVLLSLPFSVLLLLSSCGISSSYLLNASNNDTQIQLSKNNFKVLHKVQGISENIYFLGIGGLDNLSLIEKAKNQMMENANLEGRAKAVVNITYDTHFTMFYPIFFKKTVTASGYVIEFSDGKDAKEKDSDGKF